MRRTAEAPNGTPNEAPSYAVVPVGIALRMDEDGESPRPGLQPLEQAPEHARRVADALRAFGYVPHSVVTDASRLGPEDRIDRAVVCPSTNVLVVHVVGHGELAEGSSDKLYVLGEDGQRFESPVSTWIGKIEDHPDRHRPQTLFILDVCHAGQPAVTAWHSRMDAARRRAWVLAATLPTDRAYGYRLSRAVARVLTKYRDGEFRFDSSVRHIPVATVYRDVERAVHELIEEDGGGLPQTISGSLIPLHADLSHLPFFPNPSYSQAGGDDVAATLPPEIARLADWAWDPEHFMRRGGGAEPVGRHWRQGYFSGREAELRTLAAWLDDEKAGPGLRVVTGKPGAGKSALLGVLVCAAHPALRRHTERLWQSIRDQAPGEAERLAVVHARRLGLRQLVAALARQLRHLHAGPGDAAEADDSEVVANPAEHLLRLVPDDGRPVTLVIDALDEADRPTDIVTALLVPLARHALAPGGRLRLLVGTRDEPQLGSLLDLARQRAHALIDLGDTPPEVLREGIRRYVEQLLSAEGPYALGFRRTAREALARSIAEELTDPARPLQGWGEYLAAGLYVHFLLAPTNTPCDTREEAQALGRRVPRTLPELLDLDLARNQHQPTLRPVLAALAHAQGRGMPEHVLAYAATAFTPSAAARPPGPLPLPELYAVLDHEARFYLRRDVDTDGTTLYRLFHEGLADWLRAHPHTPDTSKEAQP
ncbi:AAA family ATPase [Streptomyces sp. 4N509B]|uniref:AAA family ATPase n=1 Tax=Streptomyces sp. 4N509B TaxID=3457413 RepID=UPI003FCF89EE